MFMYFKDYDEYWQLSPIKQYQCQYLANDLAFETDWRFICAENHKDPGFRIYVALTAFNDGDGSFDLNSKRGFEMILKTLDEKAAIHFNRKTNGKTEPCSTDSLLITLPETAPDEFLKELEQVKMSRLFNKAEEKIKVADDLGYHQYVKDLLYSGLPTQDFRAYGGIQQGENVTQIMIMVLVIACVMETSKLHDKPIIRHQGSYFIYDGTYYIRIPEPLLKEFLSQAAIKMGVNNYIARYFQFINNLTKQFESQSQFFPPIRKAYQTMINLQNGVIVITPSGVRLESHSPDFPMFYILKYRYDPNAKYSKWQSFLDEVIPDSTMQFVLAEFIASVFISNHILKLEKALILYGSGANGKSVVFEVLCEVLGRQNVSNFSLKALCDDTGYYLAETAEKLLNWASEISTQINNPNKFKAITSGEPVEARRPYGNAFVVHDFPKLAFNTNQLPKDAELTSGFFRRFIIIPFEKTIPVEKRNPQLAQEIIDSELAGVFNWILEGLQRLLSQKGFSHSAAIDNMVEKYRKDSDSVALYIEDINLASSTSHTITLQELYLSYRVYCKDNGLIACSNRIFSERLSNYGFKMVRKNYGRIVYATK
jgi:putative DNA primase/helicase